MKQQRIYKGHECRRHKLREGDSFTGMFIARYDMNDSPIGTAYSLYLVVVDEKPILIYSSVMLDFQMKQVPAFSKIGIVAGKILPIDGRAHLKILDVTVELL